VPTKIFELKKHEHTEALKLHIQEFHNFIHHCVLYIFLGLCKSRAEGRGDMHYSWVQYMENLKKIIYYEDIGIGGRIYCIKLAYNMI
jgi:hypothetical protein